jgi:predicted DNA-binding transcriptional regulator AlpA
MRVTPLLPAAPEKRSEAPDQQGAGVIQPLLLDSGDLCTVLRISLATLHRLKAAGKLPRARRLGSQLRWLLSEIKDWCAAGMPDCKTWEAILAAQRDGRQS